jgi:hypothetical protein
MLIRYSTNNSGGRWWLKDNDWYALEKAGWKVEWIKDEPVGMFHKAGQDRWLGALAKYASKEFETPGEAMREFEEVAHQTVSDEGCNCCGAPHSFSWENNGCYNYASGEDCLSYMYNDVPRSLRDACSDEME